MKSLFKHFDILEDPRSNSGKKYELNDLIVMTIYGILNNHSDYTNIAYFLKLNQEYFINLLDLKHGVPSHDCLSDLFAILNPYQFIDVFIDWIKSIVKVKSGNTVNIDGKAIKSARDAINGGNTPYILSAFLADMGISIGQVKVDDKSNEITAIPDLLDLIDIKGATITIDAMGTHSTIANKIVSKQAHYILKVKKNQKTLLDDIKTYFNFTLKDKHQNEISTFNTNYEKDHGRIEKREYFLSKKIDCISDKETWSSVNAIGMVIVERIKGEKRTKETHYYIIDHAIKMEQFIKSTRYHWSIECSLHWVLDVILDEDHSRSRKEWSLENLSIIRKIVFNLAKLDTRFGNVPLKRKLTQYNHDFKNIESLLFDVIPSIN